MDRIFRLDHNYSTCDDIAFMTDKKITRTVHFDLPNMKVKFIEYEDGFILASAQNDTHNWFTSNFPLKRFDDYISFHDDHAHYA